MVSKKLWQDPKITDWSENKSLKLYEVEYEGQKRKVSIPDRED